VNDGEHKNAITELSAMLNRGYSTLLSSSGKVIAIIAAVVAALVTFTDVTFASLTSESFTSSLLVMLVSSYLIYFSLEDTGEKFGEGTEEYRSALISYRAIQGKITPESIEKLRVYCSDYSEAECEYRRRLYLASSGLSVEEYERFLSGEKASKKNTRVLKNAQRIHPLKLTPSTLLTQDGSGSSELKSPERGRILSLLLRLIPSTLGTLFTVSVILTAKDGLDAAAVIEGILKLSALPIIGFKGYTAGYEFAKGKRSEWLKTKARILEGFIRREV
jgi:hypothetical protein